MRVTRQMLHPDLHAGYIVVRSVAWFLKRAWFRRLIDWLGRNFGHGKAIDGLDCDEQYIPSSDGISKIRIRIYRPTGHNEKLAAMLYFHGGGYIFGCPEFYPEIIQRFIFTRPCVVIAPDYRKAETQPFPGGFNDCYDSLLWAKNNADDLGINQDRFMIAGHSAGGGLTAAVTLKCRDTKEVDIAFQMPIYPMIDHHQPHDHDRYLETLVWDTELNSIGWNAYLASLNCEGSEIPAYAVPALNTDYERFPPTITFVGDLEPFYWETRNYVQALREAGVAVSFREYKGCYHAFDMLGAAVSDDAKKFTYDQYAEFYDRFVLGKEVGSTG